jgi:hypothetical protein
LGYIPKQAPGSTVYYYIEATAANGKTIARPLVAPEGYWSFCVTESVAAPEVQVVELEAMYPNPASAITVIPIQSKASVQGSLRLFNAYGQLMETVFDGNIATGSSNFFIDASAYPAGVYWLELRTGSQSVGQKLIIR